MAEYKLYRLDGAGQIAGAPELITAGDDQEAFARARELKHRAACELWQGRRLVGRVEKPRS